MHKTRGKDDEKKTSIVIITEFRGRCCGLLAHVAKGTFASGAENQQLCNASQQHPNTSELTVCHFLGRTPGVAKRLNFSSGS